MSEEFVPYQEALALKELGFDEPCFAYYTDEESKFIPASYSQEGIYPTNSDLIQDWISTPLYQQAFRWFREKYALVAEIQAPDGKDGKWNPTIHKVYGFGNHYDNDGFNTYEEAELACLRKLIEIVKQKENE